MNPPRPVNVFPCKTSLIIRDEYHRLWVQGMDYHNRLTTSGSKTDVRPFTTPIILDPKEVYTIIYHEADMFALLTSKCRLFIGQVLDNSNCEDYSTKANLLIIKVINNVKDMVGVGRTILFEKDNNVCLINHRLMRGEIEPVINDKIKLEPYISNNKVAYYRLVFSDCYHDIRFEYTNFCLCVHYTDKTMIEKQIGGNIIGLLKVQNASMYLLPGSELFDIHDHTGYADGRRTGKVEISRVENTEYPIILKHSNVAAFIDNQTRTMSGFNVPGKAIIANRSKKNNEQLLFVDDKTVYNPDGSIRLKLKGQDIEQIIGLWKSDIIIAEFSNKKSLCKHYDNYYCYNVKYVEWYFPMKVGMLVYFNHKMILFTTRKYESKILDPIDTYTSKSGHTVYLYNIDFALDIDSSFCQNDQVVVCQTVQGLMFRIEFHEEYPMLSYPLMFEPKTSLAHQMLLVYCPCGKTSKVINADKSNPFDQLMNNISNLDFPIELKVKTKYGSGSSVTRSFIENALEDFRSRYLIEYDNHTVFNSEAIDSSGKEREKILVNIGKVLHMCIVMLQSFLPIRIPLGIISQLKSRKPTINELEYFVSVAYPENADRYLDQKFDDITDYESFLRTIIHYDENNEKDCSIIASGITEYKKVINIHCLNLQTLDMYFSGFYYVTRDRLKERIHSSTGARSFIVKYIDRCSDDQVKALIKTWSGSSIVGLNNYIIDYKKINSKFIFDANNRTMWISDSIKKSGFKQDTQFRILDNKCSGKF